MLRERVEEMIKEIEGVEKQLMSMFSLSDLADLDENTMKMLKSYVRLMDQAKDLMVEQAESIDNITGKLNGIDSKLDMLLRREYET